MQAIHGLDKVFLLGKAFPGFMFQQKGMISFVSGCYIIVNYVSKKSSWVELIKLSFVSVKLFSF